MRKVLAETFLAISDVCAVIAAELRPRRKRARKGTLYLAQDDKVN